MKIFFLTLFVLSVVFTTEAKIILGESSLFQTSNTTDVIATISKETTEKQFEELFVYFKENGIVLNLNKIKYNEKNEITGIHIKLEKDGQQSSYAMHTNVPIKEIELGYKSNQLFVKPKADSLDLGNVDVGDLMQQFNQKGMSFDIDSFFNDKNIDEQMGNLSQFFQNSFGSIDELMEQMQGKIVDSSSFSNTNKATSKSSFPTYNFINTPGVEKLIIIDGKESNFETLNTLAKNNRLNIVDSLKPSTAMSLYGDKAKDGAVIATTLKK